MPAQYWVNLYDVTGAKLAVFDTWDDAGLTYTRKLDNLGTFSFSMSYLDPRWALFKKDCFFEVIRTDADHGIAPYRDFIGFCRDRAKEIDASGKQVFRQTGVSLVHLLKRRHVLYFAQTPFASFGPYDLTTGAATPVPADDAMKGFVDTNCGPSALGGDGVTGRIGNLEGTFPNFAVDPNDSLATLWEGARQYQNVLDVVREIAMATQIDFDVVMDDPIPSPIGGVAQFTMTFKTYVPYLGLDRSAPTGLPAPLPGGTTGTPAIFSPQLGNMIEPKFSDNNQDEVTVAITLGAGQLSDREFDVELDDGHLSWLTPHINETPWNNIEHTLTKRMDGVVGGLGFDGDYTLSHMNAKQLASFTYVQTAQTAYGRDWDLGDYVSFTWNDVDGMFNRRVTTVTVTVQQDNETIQPDFSDIQ